MTSKQPHKIVQIHMGHPVLGASTKILSKELINMLLCVVRIFMNQTLCNQCYLNLELGCNDYKILNEMERNHQVKTSGSSWCDQTGHSYTNSQWHGDDWYQFLPPAGTRIAEEAPGGKHCGTNWSGWMQGSHPTSLGETVTRTVCFQGTSSLTCYKSSEIKVRNCGQYFLYRLVDTPICQAGYCAK